MSKLFNHDGAKPSIREEELEVVLLHVNRIAKDSLDYLALFPGTGLCLNALSSILNVTTPVLGLRPRNTTTSDNQLQLNLQND